MQLSEARASIRVAINRADRQFMGRFSEGERRKLRSFPPIGWRSGCVRELVCEKFCVLTIESLAVVPGGLSQCPL